MLGCDTEFFQNRSESLKILEKLSKTKKDISVITKLSLSDEFIEHLVEIVESLRRQGNMLVFSVSLTSIDSALIWEPRAPRPDQRIDTLRRIYERGIKTMVAIRPLLPTIPDDELEKIVELTKEYSDGYYSGPLYLKELDPLLIGSIDKSSLEIEKLEPHWMPEGNIFYKIEKTGQMHLLEKILKKYKKRLFEGAAEGMIYLKNHEKHRTEG